MEPPASTSLSRDNREPAADSAVSLVSTGESNASGWHRLVASYPSLPYVLPLAVFMVVGACEPTRSQPGLAGSWTDLFRVDYKWYPVIYSLKLAFTLLAAWWAVPVYRTFPWRLSSWAVPVGVLGAFVWVGLCRLDLESQLFSAMPAEVAADPGLRSAFNPLAELADRPALAYGMLALRFFGLVLVVPLVEEFFLRGFVVRYVVHPNWWSVPFGQVNGWGAAAATIVPMLMHPSEFVAAAVWFSGITWLMVRTRNIWDCIVAHAVTNLLLGIYVVASGDWRLL
jgi:CAAX prenyl protease-like protein